MGCDIHATLEYDKYAKRLAEQKRERDPSWYSFARDIDIDRGYYFFGLLAGVRNYDINRIDDPRGVPNNASYEFKEEYEQWEGDAHSASWVSFKELKDWKLEADIKIEFNPEKDMRDQDFYKTMELLAERYGDDNVRLVFFFDN